MNEQVETPRRYLKIKKHLFGNDPTDDVRSLCEAQSGIGGMYLKHLEFYGSILLVGFVLDYLRFSSPLKKVLPSCD